MTPGKQQGPSAWLAGIGIAAAVGAICVLSWQIYLVIADPRTEGHRSDMLGGQFKLLGILVVAVIALVMGFRTSLLIAKRDALRAAAEKATQHQSGK